MRAPCQILKGYAASRERAYKLTGHFNAGRARAVSRIRQVADMLSQKPPQQQLSAVRQCKDEIIALMPSEQSRFASLRQTIQQLITKAYARVA